MRHILFFLPVAMLLAACTQDELTEQTGAALPEPIPLELSAAIGEAVAVPTRATTADGQWPDGGTVYVQISEFTSGLDNAEVLAYTVDTKGNLTPPASAKTIYWTNNGQAYWVRAWYPGTRNEYTTAPPKAGDTWTAGQKQSQEAYLAKDDFLYAYQQLTFGLSTYRLNFSHLMSKITINLENSDYLKQYGPEKVSVSLITTTQDAAWCVEGAFEGSGKELKLSETAAGDQSTITPFRKSAVTGDYYASYEAIVIPQDIGSYKGIRVRVDKTTYQWAMELDGATQLESGYEYTFDITVKEQGLEVSAGSSISWSAGGNGSGSVTLPIEIDLSQADSDITINDDKAYLLTGTGSNPVKINGDATVILQGVSLTTSTGNAISVESGNPTIHVKGANNSVTGNNAGIYVAQGSTLTITGDSRSDQLTATGGNGSCGIGGYMLDEYPWTSSPCGNISITNVSVYAQGGSNIAGNYAPGTGNAGSGTGGTIEIDNATVQAYGVTGLNNNFSTPGIGCGMHTTSGIPSSIPKVIISGQSEVHAHRGANTLPADYIGWATDIRLGSGANSTIKCGTGGGVYNSTVYCYTGDTLDKTVKYDENGNGYEQ